jgi:hypothetical protein
MCSRENHLWIEYWIWDYMFLEFQDWRRQFPSLDRNWCRNIVPNHYFAVIERYQHSSIRYFLNQAQLSQSKICKILVKNHWIFFNFGLSQRTSLHSTFSFESGFFIRTVVKNHLTFAGFQDMQQWNIDWKLFLALFQINGTKK